MEECGVNAASLRNWIGYGVPAEMRMSTIWYKIAAVVLLVMRPCLQAGLDYQKPVTSYRHS